jgi:hypothetical protein
MRRLLVGCVLSALLAGCAGSPPASSPAEWPDSFVSRLAALALIQELNAELLASRSATATLEGWCSRHRLADPPRITAHRIEVDDSAPGADQRQRLQVGAAELVKYRRVQLRCGERVLSEAENWYVPGRLAADMNRVLETTETPFGKVVKPLDPYRRTFGARLLWSPLPAGWEIEPLKHAPASGQLLRVPAALLEHRALLYDGRHRPLAELHEVYQRGLLAFPLASHP